MTKKAAVISMGQTAEGKFKDIRSAVTNAELTFRGLLDGLSAEHIIENCSPRGDETFIVSNLADGTEVRIAERVAISLVNEIILDLDEQNYVSALILCTGHFDIPDVSMNVLVPERIIPALLRALDVKRLGSIVPEEEQVADTVVQYREFNPIIRASSPYGTKEELADTARLFKEEEVDLIMTDCMGFTQDLGAIVSEASGKQVFVPRVILPALLNALLC